MLEKASLNVTGLSENLEGREGRHQAGPTGPKGRNLEVGPGGPPRFLVCYIFEKEALLGYKI